MPRYTFYNVRIVKFLLIVSLLIISPFLIIFPQNGIKGYYQYLSPLPNAILVQPESEIIIRKGSEIDPSTLNNKFIEVKGSKSGLHNGNLILSDDGKTIIFKTNNAFSLGEIVNVKIIKGMKDRAGKLLAPIQYNFRILRTKVNPDNYNHYLNPFLEFNKKNSSELQNFRINNSINRQEYLIKTQLDSVPPDFPYATLTANNNPTPGLTFAAPIGVFNQTLFGYLMIMDRNAVPIFYKRFGYPIWDFKLQSTGELTFRGTNSNFYVLDSSYSEIDSLRAGNGYDTDLHELIILPNHHSLLIADDDEIVNMDTVISGGDTAALVIGNIIQELDQNKNVVFQWRSWDHFKITDATPDIDLRDSIIDYEHANAIEVDTDGNLLLSSRHMDEITKINRQTGDIIWRWGGEYCVNRQFTFTNDSTGFTHQHDIRRIANGDLTLFDNGNLHNPRYTRICEYQMDEINKTVKLVWQYENNPVTWSGAMGKVQRLSDGNTFIGWGANTEPPSISEVTPDDSITWAVSFPDGVVNYRAFKFNWRTNYFLTNPDSISFVNVQLGSSDTSNFTVTNNSDSKLLINEIYTSDSVFTVVQSPPFYIPPHSDTTLSVKYEPTVEGETDGWIHLRSNRYTEMIAQTIFVRGMTDSVFTSVGSDNLVKSFKLYQNYPNPFNPTTTITYRIPFDGKVKLNVYDVLGREVVRLIDGERNQGMHKIVFNASKLTSGVYFYRIEVNKTGKSNIRFTNVKKLILLK